MCSSTPTITTASKVGTTTSSTNKTESTATPVNAAQPQCTCDCGCTTVVRYPGGNLCERCNWNCV